jgi:hypothetical protein
MNSKRKLKKINEDINALPNATMEAKPKIR